MPNYPRGNEKPARAARLSLPAMLRKTNSHLSFGSCIVVPLERYQSGLPSLHQLVLSFVSQKYYNYYNFVSFRKVAGWVGLCGSS